MTRTPVFLVVHVLKWSIFEEIPNEHWNFDCWISCCRSPMLTSSNRFRWFIRIFQNFMVFADSANFWFCRMLHVCIDSVYPDHEWFVRFFNFQKYWNFWLLKIFFKIFQKFLKIFQNFSKMILNIYPCSILNFSKIFSCQYSIKNERGPPAFSSPFTYVNFLCFLQIFQNFSLIDSIFSKLKFSLIVDVHIEWSTSIIHFIDFIYDDHLLHIFISWWQSCDSDSLFINALSFFFDFLWKFDDSWWFPWRNSLKFSILA